MENQPNRRAALRGPGLAEAYIDSQPRPQDPRLTGDVAETRRKFHNSANSEYVLTVNGALLGQGQPTNTKKVAAAPEARSDPAAGGEAASPAAGAR